MTSLRLAQASRIRIVAIGIARAAPGGGFRHHGDADIGGDHLADRIEIPQPCPDLQAQAEPRGVLGDVQLQRGRLGQADEVVAGHLLKVDLPPAGERPAPRRHQRQPVRSKHEPLDSVGQRVFRGETEIGGAARDRRGDVGAFTLLDVDTDIRIVTQERGERFRKMLRQPYGVGEQMDARPDTTGEAREIATHGVDIVQDQPRMIEQALARGGQGDPAAATREQRNPERILESLDPLARRRQREMGAVGAAGDAARVGDGHEKLEVDQIETHGRDPSRMHRLEAIANDGLARHSGMVRSTRPQMRRCASGNLEIPGSMLRIAPE